MLAALGRPLGVVDRGLLPRIAAGDESALRALYDQMGGRVRALALRLLRESVEADDVVQDTFLEVWRSAASYEPSRGSVSAWVTTIAHHRAVDRIRRQAARVDDRSPLQDDAEADGVSPLESTAQRQSRERITRAIAALPPEQREAIQLMYLEGLSHSETAERLGAALGTVKGRIRAAMQKLAVLLDGIQPEAPS